MNSSENNINKPAHRNSKVSSSNTMSNNLFDKTILRYKIIIIGDASVGKTAILQRFIHNKFKSEYLCTIGVDYWVKSLSINKDFMVDLQIWDTCGQERFKTITRQYYRDTHGCLLVFDLSKKETFKNIEVWLEDTRNFGNKDMDMLIVGNKSDLVGLREVTIDEIDLLIKKYNFKYIEVSALTGENVKTCFEKLANLIFTNEANNVLESPKSKKKYKADNRNITVNKSFELADKSLLSVKKNNCC